MLKIAIATTSSYKVNAIKKALYEIDFDFDVFCVDVKSDVSEQPKALNETKQGSINRAKNPLVKSDSADMASGVEFGYEPSGETYKMLSWVSVATKNGKIFSEHSSSLELPYRLKQALEKGEEV